MGKTGMYGKFIYAFTVVCVVLYLQVGN